MDKTSLGDRMKFYEDRTSQQLLPMLPVAARVDGRCFSGFTKGLDKPFDNRFYSCMYETAMNLAKETSPSVVHSQSDEITLIWTSDSPKSQIWFNGRHSKMVSNVAALATLYFYQACQKVMANYCEKQPSFDARVWQLPTKEEAVNLLVWRERDAVRNSINSAVRSYYGHKETLNKTGVEKQDMLMDRGVNWNNYPRHFKRGFILQPVYKVCVFPQEELERLPENHQARDNPVMVYKRKVWESVDLPVLNKISNKEGVIFRGEECEPVIEEFKNG